MKIRLLKGLYRRGYDAEKVRRLFRVIDWLLRLPLETERIVWKEIELIEKEKNMPYLTSVERIGIEKGMESGIEKGIEKGLKKGRAIGKEEGRLEATLNGIQTALEIRFGAAAMQRMPEVRAIQDAVR